MTSIMNNMYAITCRPREKKYGLICSLSSFIVRELLNPLSNGVSIRLEILVVSSLTESPLLRGFSSSWSITLIVVNVVAHDEHLNYLTDYIFFFKCVFCWRAYV